MPQIVQEHCSQVYVPSSTTNMCDKEPTVLFQIDNIAGWVEQHLN